MERPSSEERDNRNDHATIVFPVALRFLPAFRLFSKKPNTMRTMSTALVFCMREVAAALAKGLFGYVNYNSQMEIDRMHENTQIRQKG